MRIFLAAILVITLSATSRTSLRADGMVIEVFKSPSCGCCQKWVDHLNGNGFDVVAKNVSRATLSRIKRAAGVPQRLASCHTAKVGDYFIEGHVPASDVRRFLKEKPVAKGLAVPGMPIGSPGMEMGDKREPYEVLLVKKDGTIDSYATH